MTPSRSTPEAPWHATFGAGEGITDALLRVIWPIPCACFWCPPLRDGRLGLHAPGW